MGEQSPAPARGSRAWAPEESGVAKTFNPFSISGVSHMSKAGLCREAGGTPAQPPWAARPLGSPKEAGGSCDGRFCALVEP